MLLYLFIYFFRIIINFFGHLKTPLLLSLSKDCTITSKYVSMNLKMTNLMSRSVFKQFLKLPIFFNVPFGMDDFPTSIISYLLYSCRSYRNYFSLFAKQRNWQVSVWGAAARKAWKLMGTSEEMSSKPGLSGSSL